jgi:hypothetical protein
MNVFKATRTPKTEKRELGLGKRINNTALDGQEPNAISTPKEVLNRSPLGQVMNRIGLQIG